MSAHPGSNKKQPAAEQPQICNQLQKPQKRRLGIETAKAEQHVRKMLRRIRNAHQTGRQRDADHLVQEYLRSNDARYIALIQASAKLKEHRRPNAGLLPCIAQRLNPWAGTREKVIFMPQQKEGKPNEYRPILDFGIENRALQYLVRSVLDVRADLHPNQYVLKGVHQAIGRVAELLVQGDHWAIETDIKDCYPSFDGEKVPDLLPVPKRVTQSCLLGASLRLRVHPSLTFGQAGAGRG
jgi:hypothetical protein